MNDKALEDGLEGLRLPEDSARNEAALKAALEAFDAGREGGLDSHKASGRSRPSALIGRILRGPVRKAAAAGLLIALAAVAYFAFPSGPSVTLADVQKAFEGQKWVHIKFDNGDERWYDLPGGKFYSRKDAPYSNKREVCVLDLVAGRRQFYEPDRNAVLEDSIAPMERKTTPWEAIVRPYEKCESHVEVVDGRRLVRFQTYVTDLAGKRAVILQLWADETSRLPVRERDRLQHADRVEQKREFITGYYDFPTTGPSSIYDLGVARNTPIVKPNDKPDLLVQETVQAGKAARERFPKRYRLVAWADDLQYGMADVIYRDNERMRYDHYCMRPASPQAAVFPVGGPVDQILNWAQGQTAVNITLVTDGRAYWRSASQYPDATGTIKEPTVQTSAQVILALGDPNWPPDAQWCYVGQEAHLKALTDASDVPPGCVALRSVTGDWQRDYYVEPGHDYACVREIWWEKRGDKWEKEREYQLSDFAALPTGQWYPTRKTYIGYGNPERNIVGNQKGTSIDISLVQDADLPQGIFDAAPVLKGAKEIPY